MSKRQLTLMRHAKSSWEDPQLVDFARPLNPRGQADVPRVARWLLDQPSQPDQWLVSPARRTRDTWALLLAQGVATAAQAIWLPSIYEAPWSALMSALREQASADHVGLLGHNPGISALAHALADCPFDDMPTAAVAQLTVDCSSWSTLTPGCGRLMAFCRPRTLR